MGTIRIRLKDARQGDIDLEVAQGIILNADQLIFNGDYYRFHCPNPFVFGMPTFVKTNPPEDITGRCREVDSASIDD